MTNLTASEVNVMQCIESLAKAYDIPESLLCAFYQVIKNTVNNQFPHRNAIRDRLVNPGTILHWHPIETVPKTGEEVLLCWLGVSGENRYQFSRWLCHSHSDTAPSNCDPKKPHDTCNFRWMDMNEYQQANITHWGVIADPCQFVIMTESVLCKDGKMRMKDVLTGEIYDRKVGGMISINREAKERDDNAEHCTYGR